MTARTRAELDEPRLLELIEESEDLQVDALADARAIRPDLAEIGAERRAHGRASDPDELDRFRRHRRRLLGSGTLGLGALAAKGLMGGALGTGIMAALAPRAGAQEDDSIEVQIFNTASSLENLAVATYEAALGLPFIADGNPIIVAFAETTRDQHAAHSDAFNQQAETLGGQRQDGPNPVLDPMIQEAAGELQTPADVVALAASLEQVATQTYLANLTMLGGDGPLRLLMASVMGVEAQHLATLRAVGALLDGGADELIAIPTDPAALPAAAGSVAFPEPFEAKDEARPPEEGAVA